MVQEFAFKSSDTIHKMMETLIDQEKEKKRLEDSKPKLMTALSAHLAKLVESKAGEEYYAGGREPVKSPEQYMEQCEALLSKLDGICVCESVCVNMCLCCICVCM